MTTERGKDLYAEEFGRERLARQLQLAKQFWPCCGEHHHGPHHEACAKYVEPEPTVHDDQESLL